MADQTPADARKHSLNRQTLERGNDRACCLCSRRGAIAGGAPPHRKQAPEAPSRRERQWADWNAPAVRTFCGRYGKNPKRTAGRQAAGLTAKSFRELASGREALERRQREKARQANEEARKKLIEELAQRRLTRSRLGGNRSAGPEARRRPDFEGICPVAASPPSFARDGGRADQRP